MSISRKKYLAGVKSGLVPVNVSALKRVVQGDVSGLVEGFEWSLTPQGSQRKSAHWVYIFNGEKRLSKRSRRFVNSVVNAAR